MMEVKQPLEQEQSSEAELAHFYYLLQKGKARPDLASSALKLQEEQG